MFGLYTKLQKVAEYDTVKLLKVDESLPVSDIYDALKNLFIKYTRYALVVSLVNQPHRIIKCKNRAADIKMDVVVRYALNTTLNLSYLICSIF